MPLQQSRPVASWAAGPGSEPPPLLSPGEASPGVLCPVLCSSVQERHGHTVHIPIKGLEYVICEESLGDLQLFSQEKVQRDLIYVNP